MPEHLVIPVAMAGSPHAGAEHPPIPANVPVYDVFSYLGFLAGQTEQIHFGTQVYNIGLRHPFVVARAVTTLDVVSGGRVEFGIGASWLEAEWEAVGLDFTTRGRRVDETIEVCQRLWSEEVVEHHGEFFDFGPVMFEPKPIHAPWPPLHIGGDGPAALRRAATVGDGWIPMNHALEEIPADAKRIAQLRHDAGRPGPSRSPSAAATTSTTSAVGPTSASAGRWSGPGDRARTPSRACAASPRRRCPRSGTTRSRWRLRKALRRPLKRRRRGAAVPLSSSVPPWACLKSPLPTWY